jgi:ankyrin repeat protein
MRDKIVENVIDKYLERSQVGITKYGTTLENNNKDNYLKHLQEELMDATLYLEKLMTLNKEITELVRNNSDDANLGQLIRQLIR